MDTKERGMTLIEVLVAAAILLVGIVPLVRVLMFGLETGNRAHKMTIATNLARDLAEEIRIQAFSEEYVYPSPQCNINNVYPKITDVRQCFGKESGETVDTVTNGGRINVFDDIDDYDRWCRGDCNNTPNDASDDTSLETFDGFQYNGNSGYPPYIGFTRRVRIHNIDVGNRHVAEFFADPFASYTTTENTQFIKRYNFENWSALTSFDGGPYALGLTPLKRIEITVTYSGPGVSDVEVVDVSYAVMPISTL